ADLEHVGPHGRLDFDPVADLELVEVVEGPAVGGAVTRDHCVARLAGNGSPRHVPGPLLEGLAVDSLEDDLVHSDRFDRETAQGLALRDGGLRSEEHTSELQSREKL